MADDEDTEPMLSEDERLDLLVHFQEEFNETIEGFKADGRVDPADAVESVLDLALRLLISVVPTPIAAVLQLVGPVVKGTLVGAVGKSDKSQTPEGMRKRVESMRAKSAAHVKVADRLESTPKKEFMEKTRIRSRRRRAKSLLEDARVLEASIPA